MGPLSFLYKHGLWTSWPIFIVGLYVLCWSVVKVVKLNDKNLLCSLPLKSEQAVEFNQPGRVLLCLEGPQLSTRFRRLSFELTGNDGQSLQGHRSLFRLHSSGFSRTRIGYRVYDIPQPGRYALTTKGLGMPQPRDEDHHILFVRPYLLQGVLYVLGIILGAFLTIGSLVNFFLRLSQAKEVSH